MPLQPSDYDRLFSHGLSFQEPDGDCCAVRLERGSFVKLFRAVVEQALDSIRIGEATRATVDEGS